MKTILLSAAAALALLAVPAAAQDANANSASASGVIANIQGAAGAVSNNTFTSPAKTELRNVPAVSAPGVVTAFNCAQAVSAGASIVGGGISFGGTYTDKNCERIAQAAALNTLAGADAALYHLATGDPEICKTLRDTGRISPSSDCGDGPSVQPVAATRSAPRPAPKPALIYTKCEVDPNGAIRVGLRKGGDRALAVSQCRAALGR